MNSKNDTGKEPAGSSDAESQRRKEEERLEAMIDKLLPDHQTIIRLRHREKLSFKQIGKEMDRTMDSARELWNLAIEELSKNL